jgi:Ala-tRNA(Pro) deacylase
MPLSERLRSFLDSHHVEFTLTTHRKAFTAREVAAAEHLPAGEVAKTVVIFGDSAYSIVVLAANKVLDLHEVRSALGLSRVRLATEEELATLFPDCELGAMPPLGPLYSLPVFVDSSLLNQTLIAFNAGTHLEVIHMRTADYLRLVSPQTVTLSRDPAMSHGF